MKQVRRQQQPALTARPQKKEGIEELAYQCCSRYSGTEQALPFGKHTVLNVAEIKIYSQSAGYTRQVCKRRKARGLPLLLMLPASQTDSSLHLQGRGSRCSLQRIKRAASQVWNSS